MNDELYHHGRLGQKWGQRNGPPYPLGREQMSDKYRHNGGISDSAEEKYGNGSPRKESGRYQSKPHGGVPHSSKESHRIEESGRYPTKPHGGIPRSSNKSYQRETPLKESGRYPHGGVKEKAKNVGVSVAKAAVKGIFLGPGAAVASLTYDVATGKFTGGKKAEEETFNKLIDRSTEQIERGKDWLSARMPKFDNMKLDLDGDFDIGFDFSTGKVEYTKNGKTTSRDINKSDKAVIDKINSDFDGNGAESTKSQKLGKISNQIMDNALRGNANIAEKLSRSNFDGDSKPSTYRDLKNTEHYVKMFENSPEYKKYTKDIHSMSDYVIAFDDWLAKKGIIDPDWK